MDDLTRPPSLEFCDAHEDNDRTDANPTFVDKLSLEDLDFKMENFGTDAPSLVLLLCDTIEALEAFIGGPLVGLREIWHSTVGRENGCGI